MDSLFWKWFAVGLCLLGTVLLSLVICGVCQLLLLVLQWLGLWREVDADSLAREE